MDERQIITLDRGDIGQRLDLVLHRHLRDKARASRTRIQRWIDQGLVSVNGHAASRSSRRTLAGDSIAVDLPAPAKRAVMRPEALPLDVVYEDDFLIAVNKPAGMVVHPTYRHPNGTLMNALLWHARSWPSGTRPSLVGRLDRMTTGILLAAKTPSIHAALQRTLANRSSDKRYLAVVYGDVKVPRGTIDVRLARSRERKRTVVSSAASALPSQTVFERLRRSTAPRVGLALLACRLMTGRTHQIRVHLAHRGWPIVGDAKYGQPLWMRIDDPIVSAALRDFPGHALHAWKLTFQHPVTHTVVTCEARPPADFERLLRVARLTG